MKLNKILSSIALASTLLSTGAMAADGTIAFDGLITASACTAITGVTFNGTTTAPGTTATVTLPNLPTTAFTTVGGYAGHTPFTIDLTGCQAASGLSTVRTLFDATSPSSDSNVAVNTGTASNVAIAILTTGGAQIDMNGISGGPGEDPGHTLTATSANVQLQYVAAYKTLATPVGVGTVAATANYTISYD